MQNSRELLSPATAAQELIRRRAARADLIKFTEYTHRHYAAARHHRTIASALEAAERGELDRIIITAPPRSGKSELASRRAPAWALGRDGRRHVIAASYNSDLATDFGREVRNIVKSPEYQRLFPNTSLAADSRAANRWHTQAGGMYTAAGVGTAVTGRGADWLLIDDPHKDRAEADSEIQRQRVWDWYTSTAYTRLSPRGVVVLIQTRWHEDDLAGRLLAQQAAGGDQWTVIELPALDRLGAPLWPERFDLPALERIRAAIGPRDWSALYQGQPAPDEGAYFLREWLVPYSITPQRETLRVYGASDYAVTSDGGDYTVHLVVGVDPDGKMHALDLWRGQTDSAEWIEAFCELVRKWKPLEWAEESGQITASIGPFLKRRQIETGAWVYRRPFPSRADKAIRAQSIRARMSMHGLYVPAVAAWRGEFERELLYFPSGRHDDQADALSLLGQLLDHVMPGQRQQESATPRWEYEADERGRIFGNVPIRELVERQRRNREREAV